jgi:hypothetical protein
MQMTAYGRLLLYAPLKFRSGVWQLGGMTGPSPHAVAYWRFRPRVAQQVIANLRFSMILLAFFGLATMLNSNSGHKAPILVKGNTL